MVRSYIMRGFRDGEKINVGQRGITRKEKKKVTTAWLERERKEGGGINVVGRW